MTRNAVREGGTPGGATAEQASATPPVSTTPPAPSPPPGTPHLDRQSEPWVGEFPGLGRVLVAADGSITVEAVGSEDHVVREQALRHGWGDPLSWVRRGFHLVGGSAVGPAESDECVLLLGDPHDVAIIVIELVNQGWQLLSDRPTPVVWDDSNLVAQPREAPLLVAKRRAAKAGVDGEEIRSDTDALAVAVPRAETPRRVQAAVQVRVRRPDSETLQLLSGHERFEAATSLYVGGVLDPTFSPVAADQGAPADADDAAPNLLAEHLRISQLPWARLHLSSRTATEDAAALVRWWDTVHYVQGDER